MRWWWTDVVKEGARRRRRRRVARAAWREGFAAGVGLADDLAPGPPDLRDGAAAPNRDQGPAAGRD